MHNSQPFSLLGSLVDSNLIGELSSGQKLWIFRLYRGWKNYPAILGDYEKPLSKDWIFSMNFGPLFGRRSLSSFQGCGATALSGCRQDGFKILAARCRAANPKKTPHCNCCCFSSSSHLFWSVQVQRDSTEGIFSIFVQQMLLGIYS